MNIEAAIDGPCRRGSPDLAALEGSILHRLLDGAGEASKQ
jgi:hypothetical protein